MGTSNAIVILLLLVLIISIFFLPALMLRRSIRKVITIFRQNNAIGVKNARTPLEMGIVPRSFLQNFGRLRDYKPRALQALIQANVVNVTEDGRLYITDQSLEKIPWLKQGGIYG